MAVTALVAVVLAVCLVMAVTQTEVLETLVGVAAPQRGIAGVLEYSEPPDSINLPPSIFFQQAG
jgi:hypothetical protein